jgi:hypothetical protein
LTAVLILTVGQFATKLKIASLKSGGKENRMVIPALLYSGCLWLLFVGFGQLRNIMERETKVMRARCISTIAMFIVILPNCLAQESNSAVVPQPKIEASTFTGCYQLSLGKWWPWDFGEDTVFVTPPTRIELLPERGTVGFETNGFKIRTISPQNNVPPGRPMSSFWEIKSATKVHLTT